MTNLRVENELFHHPPGFCIRSSNGKTMLTLLTVFLQAITDRYPYEELDSEAQVIMKIIDGQVPMIHDHHRLSQIHKLWKVMQKCWTTDPSERPSATEYRKAITWIPRTIPSTKVAINLQLGRPDYY